MLCLNSDRKMPCLSICLPRLGSVSTQFEKQVKMLSNSAFLLWNNALFTQPTKFFSKKWGSFCYQQGCTASFTENWEKQRDLSILKPLRQSVCRPYLSKVADWIKQQGPEFIRSCSFFQKCIFPAHQCKSFTQPNTQSRGSQLGAIGPQGGHARLTTRPRVQDLLMKIKHLRPADGWRF